MKPLHISILALLLSGPPTYADPLWTEAFVNLGSPILSSTNGTGTSEVLVTNYFLYFSDDLVFHSVGQAEVRHAPKRATITHLSHVEVPHGYPSVDTTNHLGGAFRIRDQLAIAGASEGHGTVTYRASVLIHSHSMMVGDNWSLELRHNELLLELAPLIEQGSPDHDYLFVGTATARVDVATTFSVELSGHLESTFVSSGTGFCVMDVAYDILSFEFDTPPERYAIVGDHGILAPFSSTLMIVRPNEGSIQLSWPSVPFRHYQVQYSTNLADGIWHTIHDQPGTGLVDTYSDELANPSTHYRLIEALPKPTSTP